MKNYLLLLILVIGLTISSCKKYEVQYGTGTATSTVLLDDTYEIAYSTRDGVFLINSAMSRSKMLVSFDNALSPKAGRVALSKNRDKVAYVSPNNGVPIIVDTAGNVLIELTQYTRVQDLGWYNNDETLYILSNNQVYFYGPSLDLPTPLFPIPSNTYAYEVTSIDINENLDVAYGSIYYKHSGNYREWYYCYSLNYKNPALVDVDNTNRYGSHSFFQNVAADSKRTYHTVRFSDSEDRNGPEEITTSFIQNFRFEDDYTFRKKGFELSIDDDGYLFKKEAHYGFNYEARLWHIDSNGNPLYVDWALRY